MLYREIIAVCSEIYKEHINTLCGQNLEVFSAFTKLLETDFALSIIRFVALEMHAETRQLMHRVYQS